MKQILQNLRTGTVSLADVPCPMVRPGHLLIQTRATVISVGSERTLVEFGKGSLIAKARSQPEKVSQVLGKIKTEGLMPTLEAVFARLDEPLPLGYCNAGTVVEVGPGVDGYSVGDRVISNGPHAEMVCVPVNLCAKTPDAVPDDQAAFTVLGSIALQGLRLLQPTLGERVVVTGLGLVGLMAVQLLRASGCSVLGIDLDPRKLELARRFGAETVDLSAGVDPVAAARAFSLGRGADAVLITASAKSNDIMHESAEMCRKRGRIVLVGVVGLDLRRSDFYEKEISFQVSCSYGPGRYDAAYEEQGRDYPLAFVRWTEQRNFEAVLDMMASGRLDLAPLIEKRIPQTEAPGIYDALATDRGTLGLVLTYPDAEPPMERAVPLGGGEHKPAESSRQAVLGVIGAGNFTKLTLMPALAKTDARLRSVASRGGVTGAHIGRKFGFEQTTTDYKSLLADPEINAVVITTRHDIHAEMTIEALEAGKHVFVEKPLALNNGELQRVQAAFDKAVDRLLMVGFNRRFSPHIDRIRECITGRTEPLCMIMTVNAGFIPPDHWTQDPDVGGGRIIGEGCHWIDLMSCLAASPVVAVSAATVGAWNGPGTPDDKMTITLSFEDGSIGTLHYFANGDKRFPKERLDVFCGNGVLHLDNFRTLRGFGVKGLRKFKTPRVDKGHAAELAAFVDRVETGGAPLIPFPQLVNVTTASFAAVRSAREGRPIDLGRSASAES